MVSNGQRLIGWTTEHTTHRIARSCHWTSLFSFLLLTLCATSVRAYIPAAPTNQSAPQGNGTTTALLALDWFRGTDSTNVSYQLVGADSTGYGEGPLLHFSELHLDNDTTSTPWIALISCDANATDASQERDIFTAARDKGAVSALLYSKYSERCEINPEYADPQNFDQVMDIFSSFSLSSSQQIESEYNKLNQPKYRDFNATLLNATASLVNNSLAFNNYSTPNYLFAKLIAANATVGNPNGDTPDDNGGDNTMSSPGPHGATNSKNSLAMIILYAITGCVSALFCVVIVSGAIRAIRHPERYGPRAAFGSGGDGNFVPSQSRARGVTRAILDTFPVVKFGRSAEEGSHASVKDVESASSVETKPPMRDVSEEVELREMPAVSAMLIAEGRKEQDGTTSEEADVVDEARGGGRQSGRSRGYADSSPSSSLEPASHLRRPAARASTSAEATASSATDADLVPDAIGRETCPICIVDFEEGDDLRVLPCEGHHRFHQQCVDPWLLELSSSCPLCRQDFHVLETMMSSDGHGPPEHGDHLEPPHPHYAAGTRPLSTAGARLSRYLKLARRTRRRNREGVPHGYDPTYPPMPYAPETSL